MCMCGEKRERGEREGGRHASGMDIVEERAAANPHDEVPPTATSTGQEKLQRKSSGWDDEPGMPAYI